MGTRSVAGEERKKKPSRVLYRIKVRRHIPRLFRFLSSPGEVDEQVTERSTTRARLSKLISLSLLLSRVSFVIFLFSYYCSSQSFISLFFYGISLRRRRRRKLSAFSLLPLRALCRFLDGKLVSSSTFTLMVSF